MANVFEHEPCSRCGGSGHHSYNQRDGSTCWGCNGKGWQKTKRGEAASHFFAELFTVPMTDAKPGDVIFDSGRWRVVESSDPEKHRVRFKCGTTLGYSLSPDMTVRRKSANEEERQAALSKALAYQSSLTKAGKPRKRDEALPEQHSRGRSKLFKD